MSRRKQARPKSCKSEEIGDIEEIAAALTPESKDEATQGNLIDLATESTDEVAVADDQSVTMTSEVSEASPSRAHGTSLIAAALCDDNNDDGGDKKVMKCETCSAVFDSLDQFMDHRNFECGADVDTKTNWLLSETNSTRSMSPSSQSTSSVDGGASGATDVDSQDLETMDPTQVPYVIGVNDDNPYNCQFCEKAFARKGYLKLHEQTHAVHMPYKCRHCPRLFRHKKSRERHEKLHSSDRKYKCKTCGVGYSRSDHLRNHMRNHALMENDEGYKCPVCQQSYMSASALTNHLKTHKPKSPPVEEPSEISRQDCPRTFSNTEDLEQHILTTHTNDDMPHVKVEKMECDVCQEVFPTQEQLDAHAEEMHCEDLDFKCPVCFLGFSDTQELCHHILSHNPSGSHVDAGPSGASGIMRTLLSQGSNLKMEDTSMSVSSSVGASNHTTVSVAPPSAITSGASGTASSGAEPLICPYCLTDGFESLESLELHLTSVHSVKPTEVYTCNYCNAPYPNLYSLHDHMTVVHRSQHGLDITYPCSMCVQRFHSLDALAKHKGIVHAQQRSTGIDAAFCNRCNMTLASPRSLEEHMATVHNIIMDKSYKSSKTKGKKLGGKGGKDKDKSPHSASHQSGASKSGHKNAHAREKSLASLPHFSQNENWQEGSRTDKISAMLAKKAATENFLSHPSLGNTSPGLLPTSLTCDQCNATFHDPHNFAAHMALHTESGLNLSLAQQSSSSEKVGSKMACDGETVGGGHSEVNQNQNSSSTNKSYECFKCGATFSMEEQLEAHATLHYLCVSTEYGCSSCVKNFSKPDELQKHLMDIHAHHLYRCALCKDIFDSKVNIQVHFAIKHSNECKLYKCLSCDIMFRSEMEWQVHVRVNHLHMARPYRCLFCQESFTSEVELQCHLTTHSKQFTCPMCDQAFHIEYLLDQHMQNCHSDTKPDVSQKSSPGGMKSPAHNSVSPFRNITIKQEKEEISQNINTSHGSSSYSSSSSSSSSSSCSPRIILKSPMAPSPSKQAHIISPQTPISSISPLPTPASVSMATPASAIWKNTEPLHMCNICDVKFCDIGLLSLHKAQDHGLKGAGKPVTSDGDFTVKSEHEKLLLSNQTLLSALTTPASPVNSAPPTSPMAPPQTQLSCMFCSQTFKTSIEYNKHMKIHVNSGNLTCSICDETFTSASVLAEHKLTHCKIQQGNTCVVCRVTLSNQEQFYMHAQEHGFEGSLLQCVVCRQTLSSLVELQMHGRHHFQTRPAFFTCCVCLKSFESKENLVSKLNSSGRTYYVCKPCYHGEAPLHTCSQCSEKFATAQLLETHMQTHKASFQCIKCQQSFSSEYEIQLHVTTHMLTEGTQHECRLCGALFESPARLQTHLIQHSFVGKDIICFVCNKIFESPQEIQVHALEHGSTFRKYNCPQCSQKFFFTAELDNHKLIYNHGVVSSASTSPLPSSASSSSSLSASALLSSSAALSMATLASFLSSSPLLKSPDINSSLALTNKKLFEGLTIPNVPSGYDQQALPDQPATNISKTHDTLTIPTVPLSSSSMNGLQCPECSKYFSTGTALANHRKTHWKKDSANSIRCSLCSQTFHSATAMQQHFFTVHSSKEDEHKKKKSFKCMMCEKECSTLSALQNHILSHRTGNSLPCPVCRKTFTSQRYLNLHMRVHKSADKKRTENNHDNSVKEEQPITETMPETSRQSESTDLCCPVCGQGFASTQEIDVHIKTHEEVFTTLGNSSEAMECSGTGQAGCDNDDNAMEVEDR